jgi:NitT/TauT family transport system permease protein
MHALPPVRPEYERELAPLGNLAVERELPLAQRVWQQAWVRKL